MDEKIEVCSNTDVDATDALGQRKSQKEIAYLCHDVVLYTVIVVTIYNLTGGHGDSNL